MFKQDYGIRVLSATQPISDDEGGEFYEMFLEWNDEKYSTRLSKRVRKRFREPKNAVIVRARFANRQKRLAGLYSRFIERQPRRQGTSKVNNRQSCYKAFIDDDNINPFLTIGNGQSRTCDCRK